MSPAASWVFPFVVGLIVGGFVATFMVVLFVGVAQLKAREDELLQEASRSMLWQRSRMDEQPDD